MDIDISVKSVKQLTNEIKFMLEEKFPYIWVKGEVGPVKLHSSGHRYFSLKEDDYVINAICWRGTPIAVELTEGMLVECYAKVTIFGGRSSYQIIAKEIRAISSKGDILMQLELLKKKLIEEGVFNLKNQDAIVLYPKKIAILTSPTGAVLHDMMHRIQGRFPCVEVLFFPIAVQGQEAQKSILDALEKVEKYNDIDTVILARGGGSLEDLWVFNDEQIVRKVSSLCLPIITAIGHETDTTLVDFASNLRAPTPSSAIEFCTPDKNELYLIINANYNNLISHINDKMLNLSKVLEQCSDYDDIFSNIIDQFMQRIDHISVVAADILKSRIKEYELNLSEFSDSNLMEFSLDKMILNIENLYDQAMNNLKNRYSQYASIFQQYDLFLNEKEQELKQKVIILDQNKHKILSKSDIKKLNFAPFSLNFFDGAVNVAEFEQHN